MKQIDRAITLYADTRTELEAQQKEAKAAEVDLKAKMDRLEMYIQAGLEELKLDKVSANGYTASKTFKDSVTIEDKQTFSIFLVQKMLLHLQPHMYKTRQGDWQADGKECLMEHVESVMNSGALDLLSLGAHKTNCKEYMTANEGSMPNGIKYTKKSVIQIRKQPVKKGVTK